MLRSRYNQTSKPLTELLDRIHQLQTQDEYNKYLKGLKWQCLYLLLIISILLFFQTPSHIYNVWYGPFHLNLDEFIKHWNIYSGNTSAESWNFFDKQYLQIELGEDIIDIDPENIFRVHHRHPAYAKASYTFHPINEPKITKVPMKLLVKLSTNREAYFRKRLPYRFELFNSNTLKCIAKQIYIDQSTVNIKKIEEIYDRNPTDFNKKVIKKCGILLGYLYDCANEKIYTWNSYDPYIFTFQVAAFDASTSYSSYLTCTIDILLILWCINVVSGILIGFMRYIFQRETKNVSHEIMNILNMFNIDSIQSLDRLIMETYRIGDYYDQLFLLREKYLIIFKIDLNEHTPIILRQFYEKSPFSIIDIETIVEIKYYYIFTSDRGFRNQIELLGINDQRNEWLHNRLINCSENYRRQEVIRANDIMRRNRLIAYMKDEEEMQRINNNDIERIYNRVTSASPRFIAEFRLEGPRTLNTKIPENKCVICYEQFLVGDQYSRWPCAAQHMLHYQCMLELLRKQNQCPLCRHAVEAAQLPSIYDMYNMFYTRQD